MELMMEALNNQIDTLQSELPYIGNEMRLLRLDWSGDEHARLSSLLAVLQRQAELFAGMRVSLKRLYPNDTQRIFACYIDESFQAFLDASSDLTCKVGSAPKSQTEVISISTTHLYYHRKCCGDVVPLSAPYLIVISLLW